MGGSEEQVYLDVFLQTGRSLNQEYENWLFSWLGETGKVSAEQSMGHLASHAFALCPPAGAAMLRFWWWPEE